MSDPKPPRKRAQTIRVTPTSAGGEQGPLRAWLTVIRGGQDLGVQAQIDGTASIGRNPESTLCLQDLGVSWAHAQISAQGGDVYLLEDVGSTNGTRVGGTPITKGRALSDGDKIMMGESVVRFSLSDAMEIDFLQEIGQLVGTDPLTGLQSKRRFDDAFDYALKVAAQAETPVAMLMMDMDGVKQINDTHGHLFGAHVIGETGRLIARHLTPGGQQITAAPLHRESQLVRTIGGQAAGEPLVAVVEQDRRQLLHPVGRGHRHHHAVIHPALIRASIQADQQQT